MNKLNGYIVGICCLWVASVQAAPVIDQILPSQASVGAVITVQGSGFSLQQLNYIRFGKALIGPYQSSDSKQFVFTVPASALGGCNAPSFKPLHCMALLKQETVPGKYVMKVVTPDGESNEVEMEVK